MAHMGDLMLAQATCSAVLPGAIAGEALVVSPDLTLVDQLRRFLQEDARLAVQTVASYREAEQFLEKSRPGAVLIDLRRCSAGENAAPLLHQLGKRETPRVPVIAISDAGYVFDLAAVADLIVSGHVQLPLDRQQLAKLLADQMGPGGARWTGATTAPRVVEGKTIKFKTHTPEMFPLLDDLLTVAAHDVTVLLVGETGTGKTTLARLIHELSPRLEGRLVTVACGALPPELIESELFGHVKGAFTSAENTRQGKFDVAKNGTLLLDEIDVLGASQQAKLLRVIETGEYEAVGCNETRISKCRLIVASNVDLKRLMERNTFRADLYYRLSMLEMRILPLRERPRDIVPMALGFIEEFCSAHNVLVRRIHPDFLACLKHYHWPGNVRELKNHVRRAVLFCRSGILTPGELAPHFHKAAETAAFSMPLEPHERDHELIAAGNVSFARAPAKTLVEKVASSEREILEQALREHNYNRTVTAQALGLSRVGLYKKMKRFGMVNNRPR